MTEDPYHVRHDLEKVDVCCFHATHDDKGEPTGPQCGDPATHIIYWRNHTYSPGCDKHVQPEALDRDAVDLIDTIVVT